MTSMIKFDFVKNRKIFFTISIAILLVFLSLYIINGAVLDITFRGGTACPSNAGRWLTPTWRP